MAALTNAVTPTKAGVLVSATAVSASDTIASSYVGERGCYVRVINGGGSSDTVTVLDPSLTPAGNPAAPTTVAVANATTKMIYISKNNVDPATGLVTITHSFTTSVTIEIFTL